MLKIKICRISRQIRGSPPPQESASDPICGLTGLCVYLFYPNLFPSQIDFPQKNNRNAPLNVCNSFLLHLFKVKVKLEPHEEQIFVDDDDEVRVSYMYLQCRLCFIVLKVYLFNPEKIQIQKCNFFLYHSSCTIPPPRYFWTRAPPYLMVWMTAPPPNLSQGLDLALQADCY